MATDVFIEGGTVITMDPKRRVFVGDVLVENGNIAGVGKSGRLKPRPGVRTINAKGCIVMPGFVQVHVHLCQALFRGHAEDLALLPWLEKRIWPFEGAHTKRTLEVSTQLGLSEMLLAGTTSALDMGTVHHTDVIFKTAQAMGFRLTSGKAMMDKGKGHPKSLREKASDSLKQSARLADKWHGQGLMRYAYAPRFILSCSDALIRTSVADARKRGCMIHTHSSENPGEIKAVRAATGKENIVALHELGVTGDDVMLAHCVFLNAKERKLLAKTKTNIAHCPSTNLKLASGVCSVPKLLEMGINIGIGADGAPCNNRMDPFSEMRLAGLLQKPEVAVDALSAKTIVEMATLSGAKALNIDDKVGSLEAGKRADITVVDTRKAHMAPRHDPYTTLVYAATAADVKHVFVDGVWRVRNAEVVGLSMETLLDDADRAFKSILKRSEVRL